jgi:hypothetical protein
MVDFVDQIHWTTGCAHGWLNIIYGYVCDSQKWKGLALKLDQMKWVVLLNTVGIIPSSEDLN